MSRQVGHEHYKLAQLGDEGLLSRLRIIVLFAFFAIVRHADLFAEPAAEIDLTAAWRAKRHSPALVRVEELIAGWTTHEGHRIKCSLLNYTHPNWEGGS